VVVRHSVTALPRIEECDVTGWLEEFASIAAWGAAISGGLLILWNDRRLLIMTLALQYLLVTWLVSLTLPIQIAAAKLVAGLMACTILAISLVSTDWIAREGIPRAIPFGRPFRLIAILLVLFAAGAVGSENWLMLPGLKPEAILGTTFLLSLGILHLGLSEEPIRVCMGILTMMSGFEVSYSVIEPSLAVIAMLAIIHLGVALVIGYLLLERNRAQDQVEIAE
jgi:hypothetical protein